MNVGVYQKDIVSASFVGTNSYHQGAIAKYCNRTESRIQELQAKGLCHGSGRSIEFIFYDTTLENTYLRKALGFHSGF